MKGRLFKNNVCPNTVIETLEYKCKWFLTAKGRNIPKRMLPS